MSARLTVTGGGVPAARTILGAYDAEARAAAEEARDRTVRAVRANFPGSGRIGGRIRGQVTRTGGGYAITVQPAKPVRYIARFVEAGTGERGPLGRTIPRRRRGRLPSGIVPSGRGQAPQWPFERVRQSEADDVVRILEDGAADAARRIFG